MFMVCFVKYTLYDGNLVMERNIYRKKIIKARESGKILTKRDILIKKVSDMLFFYI